jgi:hypothetical protein
MSKRMHKAHKRLDKDRYPTPAEAIAPLLPFLDGVIKTFVEPCCGEGDMVRLLEANGLKCVYAGDIATGQDALRLRSYRGADAGITNPPHTRAILHRMILHLPRLGPTWLLLDSDWAHTKQAGPYLPTCTDIVGIGRVKWIKGTKSAGFENSAWYRFDARHRVGPVFHHGWGQGPLDRRPRCTCCPVAAKAKEAGMKRQQPASRRRVKR